MKLPRLTSDKMLRILKKKGFQVVRQSGSHIILRNEKGIRITLPCHSKIILHPKIMKTIINDAELIDEDF